MTATVNTTMVYSPNIDVPQENIDHCLLSRLREPSCKWELHHIKHQSLWGDPFKLEEEWERKQQGQIAAKRQRFREPSPAGAFREQAGSNIAGTSPSYLHIFQVHYSLSDNYNIPRLRHLPTNDFPPKKEKTREHQDQGPHSIQSPHDILHTQVTRRSLDSGGVSTSSKCCCGQLATRG